MNALQKSLLRIRALIKKEFLAMFRDKGTRMVLIVPVLVQAIIFGYGANFTPEQVRYAILDDARDATSAALVQSIAATPRAPRTPVAGRSASAAIRRTPTRKTATS